MMIWVNGEIVPDDALKISVLDRTFEHGLGLFETFRTWNGHATLLGRHLDRLGRSARELGLQLDPTSLPNEQSVLRLLRESSFSADAMVRLTISGGVGSASPSTVWMRPSALPAQIPEGAVLVNSELRVDTNDPLARHKTLNYWTRRLAYDRAIAAGADEALVSGVEGSRTNVFVVVDGTLITPGEGAPILPGIMRSVVLEFAARLGIETSIVPWPLPTGDRVGPPAWPDFKSAEEVLLTNSVRGIIPVRRALGDEYAAPGPVTRRLWAAILPWLESGGTPNGDR